MTPIRGTGSRPVLALLLAAGCSRGATVPATAVPTPAAGTPADSLASVPELPAIHPVRGPLALHVTYPAPDAVLQVRDSSFLFGTAGTGDGTGAGAGAAPGASALPLAASPALDWRSAMV